MNINIKTKIILGIVAVGIILAAVSAIDAISTKPQKYKNLNDPSIMWTIGNQNIVGIKAEETWTGGEYVDESGNLKEYIVLKYYISYDTGSEIITTINKVESIYTKDALDPENNNAIKKQFIQDKALELYNWALPLQDLRYNKKVPGNQ